MKKDKTLDINNRERGKQSGQLLAYLKTIGRWLLVTRWVIVCCFGLLKVVLQLAKFFNYLRNG